MNGGGRPASPPSCILQKFVLCYKNAQVLFLDQKYIGNIKQTSILNKSLQTLRVDVLYLGIITFYNFTIEFNYQEHFRRHHTSAIR